MTFYAAGSPAPAPGSPTIPVAPSNMYRSPAGPAETVGTGRQFVVVAEEANNNLGRKPKRGDRMLDSELKTMVIDEVREMFDFGGAVIGYRITVEQ